jgi:putative magnesium chelatase accessory protein
MAAALAGLLKALGIQPDFVVGHSAGAAILARMCLDGTIAPNALVSLNGAFLPLRGVPVQLFSPLTRLVMTIAPMTRLVARLAANPAAVARLLNDTGSRLDQAGIAQYQRLFRNPGHVAGALGMMASWRLESLARELGRLKPAVLLVAGNADRMISPGEAVRVQALIPGASILRLPGLGHLAHEEAPEKLAALIAQFTGVQGKRRRG